MVVIGVDFGNETCVVSCVVDGQVKIIENEFHQNKTPSFVAFNDRKRFIGVAAKNQFSSNACNTIHNFKQYLEIYNNRPLGYNVTYRNQLNFFCALHITSMLLAKLKSDANAVLKDSEVSGCVLAVPSYFTENEMKSVLAAAGIAQLNCHFLIKETTAIAINYSFYKKFPTRQNVVFVDFGHSAVQVSACAFEGEKLEVLAETSARIGGRDVDVALAAHFIDRLSGTSNAMDPQPFFYGLIEEVEKLKRNLSADSASFPLNVQYLLKEETIELSLDRSEMEQICKPLFDIVEEKMRQCLADSGLEQHQINSIEIVGGSSRIPYIKDLIKKVFGAKPKMTMTDEAISRGCLLRSILFRKRKNFTIVEKSAEALQHGEQNTTDRSDGDEVYEPETKKMRAKTATDKDEMLTIKELHSNFKQQNGKSILTRKILDEFLRIEASFLQNDAEEIRRDEARNKLEKLVIGFNHAGFLGMVDETDRAKFLRLADFSAFMHDASTEEYEQNFETLRSLIQKKVDEQRVYEEKERQKQQRDEKEKREEQQREEQREQQRLTVQNQINRRQEKQDKKFQQMERQKIEDENRENENRQANIDTANNVLAKNSPGIIRRTSARIASQSIQDEDEEIAVPLSQVPNRFSSGFMITWKCFYISGKGSHLQNNIKNIASEADLFFNDNAAQLHDHEISLVQGQATRAVYDSFSSFDNHKSSKEILESFTTLKMLIDEVKLRCKKLPLTLRD